VWRAEGERFDVTQRAARGQDGGGSLIVRGGIHKNGGTELVIVRGTFTAFKFCEQIVVPSFQTHDAIIFQEHNARPQSANSTCQVLAKNHVAALEW